MMPARRNFWAAESKNTSMRNVRSTCESRHSTPHRTLPAPRGMLTNTQPSPWFCPSGRQPGSYRETGFEEMRTQPTLDSRTPRRSGLLGVSRLHCPLTALSGPSEHPRQEPIGLTSLPELFHGLFRLCSHLSPPLLGGFRNLRSTSFRENSLFYPR